MIEISTGSHKFRVDKVTFAFTCSAPVTFQSEDALFKFLTYCFERGISSPTQVDIEAYAATLPKYMSWEWSNVSAIEKTVQA